MVCHHRISWWQMQFGPLWMFFFFNYNYVRFQFFFILFYLSVNANIQSCHFYSLNILVESFYILIIVTFLNYTTCRNLNKNH